METTLLKIETAGTFDEAVRRAAAVLRVGEVVAVPTETVYGLAANALDARAVTKIFEAKRRPLHNPVIVHCSSLEMVRACVAEWPPSAALLARQFWPGPLTLVLPRGQSIPELVTAGGPTVGIRVPAHPLMAKVIEACGFPLAAPSANLANEISPTTAQHVARSLGGRIPLIIDAGATSVGIESTVLDLTADQPRILRPGMISSEQIARVLGVPVTGAERSGEFLKSPGMLKKHYAPRARVVVEKWADDTELARLAGATGVESSRIDIIAHGNIPQANPYARVAIIPQDAEAYGRALYAELHRSDELGSNLILIEAPPPGPEWDGIRDRLKRASAP